MKFRSCYTHALLVLISLISSGCVSRQLRYSTLGLTQTVPDLQQKQIIDNFAQLAENSGAMPYFVVMDAGTASITNTGGSTLGLNGDPRKYTTDAFGLSGSIAASDNWTLKPVTNGSRLAAMRAAYLSVLNRPANGQEAQLLDTIRSSNPYFDDSLTPGWLCVGDKRDVPHDAALVGHSKGGTYVWVNANHLQDFTRFVMLTLTISAYVPPTPAAQTRQPGLPGEPPMESLPGIPSNPFSPQLYEGSSGFDRGLFLLPRP